MSHKDNKELAVVEKKGTALALPADIDFEADSDEFGANYSQEQMTTPFLSILQALSPQVVRGKSEYIKEAQAGMFFNSVTKELYDGEKGINLILSTFKESYIEWVPRSQGGGFAGEYDVLTGAQIKTAADKDFNQVIQEGSPYGTPGNFLSLTHTRLGAVVADDLSRWTPVVLSFSASALKPSRGINALHRVIEWKNPATGQAGQPGKCPMPLILWHATSITRSNDSGTWFTWNFNKKSFLYDLPQEQFLGLYRSIRDFASSAKGKQTVDTALREAVNVTQKDSLNDDIPF